jgi:hypothetical protein
VSYFGSYFGGYFGSYFGATGEAAPVDIDPYDALAYTTFELIRTKQVRLIQSLTPTVLAGQPFRIHRDPMPFMRWVAAFPRGCFRRLEILSNFDYDISETSGSLRSFRHTFDLRVGYPLELGLYGTGNERTLRDLIDSDAALLDGCIGRHGFADFRAAQERCERQEQTVLELEGARVLSIRFLVQYDTLAGGVA